MAEENALPTAPGPPPVQPGSAPLPLVGRGAESRQLRSALAEAKQGHGSTWLLRGPPGMGKSRLLLWLEDRATEEGFEVRGGPCPTDSAVPGLPFEEALRDSGAPSSGLTERASPLSSHARPLSDLPSILIIEEERPRRLFDLLRTYAQECPSLLVSRDRATVVRQREPSLPPDLPMLWLTRAEGESAISPSEVDQLGERLQKHLQDHPGGLVAMAGLEYLVSQNAFLPVLRLLQFLRDAAESTGGHLLISLPAAAFDSRQLSLIESEGEVLRGGPVPMGAPAAGGPPGAPPGPSPAEVVPVEGVDHRCLRVEQLVERYAAQRPLLLLFDDVEHLDSLSGRLFLHLARQVPQLSVVLVGALREGPAGEDPHEQASLIAGLRSLEAEHGVRFLSVGPLSASEARLLLEADLGSAIDGELPAPWAALLEGGGRNPLLLRLAASSFSRSPSSPGADARRSLAATGGASGEGAPGPATPEGGGLPSSVPELVRSRLERLGSRARLLAGAAAVYGPEIDASALSEGTGFSPAEVDRELGGLTELGLLRPRTGGGGSWGFVHEEVRDACLASLSLAELGECALGLARTWARRGPEDLQRLARLYTWGREEPEGLPWVRRAFEAALRARSADMVARDLRYWKELAGRREEDVASMVEAVLDASWELAAFGAVEEAAALLEATRERAATDIQRCALDVARADLLLERDPGRSGEALAAASPTLKALSGAAPAPLQARLALGLGRAAVSRGDPAAAVALLEPALVPPLEGSPGAELLRLRLKLPLAESYLKLGRAPEALRIFEEVRAHGYDRAAARLGPSARLLHGHLWQLEAQLYLGRGDLPRARALAEEGLRMLRETGSASDVVRAIVQLAELLIEQAASTEASQRLEEARGLAERFHAGEPLARVAAWQGILSAQRQEWGAAVAALARARTQLSAQGWTGPLGRLELLEAVADMEEGRGAAADTRLKALEKELRKQGPTVIPFFYRYRARLREREGLAAVARQDLEKGLSEARASSNRLAEGELLGELARWEQRHGERLRAQDTDRKARALLRTCGVERDPWTLPPLSG